MAHAETVIAVAGVTKRYMIYDRPADRLWQGLWRGRRQFFREFWALHEISFSIDRGETVGIIGHNGSGKSTLLQIICGTLSPSSGQVLSHGRIAALLELGAGFNPEFTGRENVFLNGAILGVPHADMRELMPELLAFADIGDFVDRPVKTYSSGMALRLAFAVATAVAPRILIVDEALAVGDEAFQRKCMGRMSDFRRAGGTLVFVSHDPAAVERICDRAVLMERGRVLEDGDPQDILASYHRLLSTETRRAKNHSIYEAGFAGRAKNHSVYEAGFAGRAAVVVAVLAVGSANASAVDWVPAAPRQAALAHLVIQDCGSCHGMRLTGGLGPPLTREALADRPPESLVATVLHGRRGTAMPPWRDFMTEAEAVWVVTRLREGSIHAPDPSSR